MIYATDNDLQAIGQLDFEERVDAMYYYLVKGWNMNEVGEDRLGIRSDQPGRLVSSLMRAYGFTGKNGGAYPRCPKQVLADFVDRYWADQHNGAVESGTFQRFYRQYQQQEQQVQQERERRERQRWQEQQRQEQLRQERERQRQEQLRREREWQEQQRQEQLRRERERQERQRQEQLRQERERQRQEGQRKSQSQSLVSQGKNALNQGQLRRALDLFYQARNLHDTWELNRLIAQTLAQSSNAAEHCDAIIRELTEYEEHLAKNNSALNAQQSLWLARAYVAKGDKSRACTYYFQAGDHYYDKSDYVQATRN